MKFIIFCTKFCFRNVACSQIAKRLEVFHLKRLMLVKIAQTENNFTAATPINAIPKPYLNCFHESNHSKSIVLKTSNAQIHTISGYVAITITNFERKTSNDFHDFCQHLLCLKNCVFKMPKRLDVYQSKMLVLFASFKNELNFAAVTSINTMRKPLPKCFRKSNPSQTMACSTSNQQINTSGTFIAIKTFDFE